jgi:hypothetical protein
MAPKVNAKQDQKSRKAVQIKLEIIEEYERGVEYDHFHDYSTEGQI